MSAREAILARVRRSLGVSGSDPARLAAVTERLERSPRGVIPTRGQLPSDELFPLFARMATRAHAAVREVALDDVPSAIERFLLDQGLPNVVRTGTDPRLAALPWARSGLQLRCGPIGSDDLAAVTHAEAGVAETGSALVVSGPENPTLLNFLPVAHIILLRTDDLVGDPETALARVRPRFAGASEAPRCVTFLTGPSRSGDIGQTLCLGAHGPRAVLVLVVR